MVGCFDSLINSVVHISYHLLATFEDIYLVSGTATKNLSSVQAVRVKVTTETEELNILYSKTIEGNPLS